MGSDELTALSAARHLRGTPCSPVQWNVVIENESPRRLPVSAAPHVLIVEDNSDTRTVLRIFLEMEGMTVTEAADGLEALDRLRHLRLQNTNAPSIILLDWMMPRCSGDAFRRMQLANASTADVPVVVISAAAESEEAFRHLEPFAVVKKPFQLDQLLAIIKDALAPH